ncbi:MAG TPA: SDR family oxidoreductase [Verrucomicrobiae bacterium]|jgi:NAD(P)-dependent dehydrogenase (short-subunit alcohol dehydrogenase family)
MAQFTELKDQAVIITGGANGIGAATVRAFHEQGARVFFCDKDADAGAKLAKELGANISFQQVNLVSESEILSWIASIRHTAKTIRALVNNAAWDPRIPFLETTTKQWDDLFALNLRAYFLMARECAPAMPHGSSIVNLSSVTFHNSPKQMVAYVATKGGVMGFTRCLARELGERGIRVNTVSPGWVFTERQIRDYLNDANKRMIEERQCIAEFIQPKEIADVILFLASDLSAAVTGQEILADRGWEHS